MSYCDKYLLTKINFIDLNEEDEKELDGYELDGNE